MPVMKITRLIVKHKYASINFHLAWSKLSYLFSVMRRQILLAVLLGAGCYECPKAEPLPGNPNDMTTSMRRQDTCSSRPRMSSQHRRPLEPFQPFHLQIARRQSLPLLHLPELPNILWELDAIPFRKLPPVILGLIPSPQRNRYLSSPWLLFEPHLDRCSGPVYLVYIAPVSLQVHLETPGEPSR